MATKFWPVVIRCRLPDGNVASRVVGIPSDAPDTTLFGEYDMQIPEGWQDWGIYRSVDRATAVAVFLETAFCQMRGE